MKRAASPQRSSPAEVRSECWSCTRSAPAEFAQAIAPFRSGCRPSGDGLALFASNGIVLASHFAESDKCDFHMMWKHKDTKARRHKEGREQAMFDAAFFVSSCLCVFVLVAIPSPLEVSSRDVRKDRC